MDLQEEIIKVVKGIDRADVLEYIYIIVRNIREDLENEFK